jgi:ABC-type transport system substrate-binding protein
MNTVPPSGIPGYDVFSSGSQDFIGANDAPNLSKAKDLLARGGWNPSTTLNMIYATDSGSAADIAQAIQSNFAKIGVKIKLTGVAGDVIFTPGYAISPVDKKNDLILSGWIQDYSDAQDWYQLFTCANVVAGNNPANYCNAGYDKIYNEALNTVDNNARYDIYKQLEAKLTGPSGDMPAAPLYQPTNDTVVATYVKDHGSAFTLSPSGLIYYEGLSVTAGKK